MTTTTNLAKYIPITPIDLPERDLARLILLARQAERRITAAARHWLDRSPPAPAAPRRSATCRC